MADFSIKAFFGGDTSGLRAAIADANKAVNDFSKESKKAGISLGSGLGFGVLLFQARRFFDAVINDAQKTRDEFEKVGRSVPDTVRSVAALADGIDSLKRTSIEWGTSFLSVITRAGEGIGMFINRLRGISREQEQQREEAARNADRLEKERDKAYAERASKEKARAEREREEAARAADKRAEDEFNNLIKVSDAQKKLSERKKQDAFETLSLEQKILTDQKASLEIAKQIADYKKNGVLSTNDQLKVIELQNQQLDINNRLAENRADLAKRTADEEARIAASQRQQADTLNAIAGIKTGEQLNELSDETLQEIVRRNTAAAAEASNRSQLNSFLGGEIGSANEAARLSQEAQNAQRELTFRRNFRRTLQTRGVDAARQSFTGDPTQFDRVLQQLTSGLTVNDKQLTELEKIRRAIGGKFINQ